MTKKIAVINLKGSDEGLFSEALSLISGYPLVQNRNMYEWKRLFQIDEKQIDSWKSQFLMASSSFIKRIKSEFENSCFISIGASFSEVLAIKLNKSVILNDEESAMHNSLLNITGRHAAKHYDVVVHLQSDGSQSFDEQFISFYEQHGIVYKTYDKGDNAEKALENIISDIKIPLAQSVESAIY